ncbi:glycosyltransferase family 2 protein [Actinoplanes sp. NEAU-H7]|uniref:Glycosyltransferase family 2 protein n=1 Tax=Actinoplanes flavus TaxID=2820290 RepID=A0ABS3UJC1_9ACTN|nr:glycosyltransferase family 2 protein [Actinoplanes flavus]MBO3738878.1 glycosyltransferase family 2 protein [Actinoplanes flavus]
MELSHLNPNTDSNRPQSPTVSVVIPTLNEERNLPHVFAKLPEMITEVIIVDGGSKDRTVEVARELRPDAVIVQQTRIGKGNALACGFAACTGDIIVMIDADGSTDPAEIPLFVDKLVKGDHFVKGSRFSHGGHSHDITKLRKLGNDGLNLVVNVLFRTHFTDLCYGYNAFWRSVVPALDLPDVSLPRPSDGSKLWGDGFEIETMINIRAVAEKLKVGEVGSTEHERIFGESNLNTFRDGFRVLRTIFSEYGRMRRRRGAGLRPFVEGLQHVAPSAAAPQSRGLGQVVNPPAPAAPAHPVATRHPADPRRDASHLNRAARREDVGARRSDDINKIRSRALDDLGTQPTQDLSAARARMLDDLGNVQTQDINKLRSTTQLDD